MSSHRTPDTDPSHTIIQLREGEVGALADVLARAFHDEPNFTYMLPDGERRSKVLPWFFTAAIRAGLRYGKVHTTETTDGGAVWLSPGKRLTFWPMLRTGLMALPFKFGWEGSRRSLTLNEQLDQVRNELVPEPHWYLMALGVVPEMQSQGIGSALIQPILKRADGEGVPSYLETFSEGALRFYTRHGFEVRGEGEVPEGPGFWVMVRDPMT